MITDTPRPTDPTHCVPIALSPRRWWAGWIITFAGFPIGGLPAIALGGVDDLTSAALGGLAAGLIIGAGQGFLLRRIRPSLLVRWSVATGIGLALGLMVGSAVVDYGTSGTDLVIQGLLSGLGVGVVQAFVISDVLRPWAASTWAATSTVLWPLGWTVTQLAGVSVEDQFAVFGATGALVYCALSGSVMIVLLRRGRRK